MNMRFKILFAHQVYVETSKVERVMVTPVMVTVGDLPTLE
jgi:hypothetical protein